MAPAASCFMLAGIFDMLSTLSVSLRFGIHKRMLFVRVPL